MMIEAMAGKSAAVHGLVHDATPFRFNENDTAVEYFGKLLELGGYNYHGTERLYSGIDGREMTADIFFGVIHYQRLRHMVSDKWQVATTNFYIAFFYSTLRFSFVTQSRFLNPQLSLFYCVWIDNIHPLY